MTNLRRPAALLVLVAVAAAGVYTWRRVTALPQPGSAVYEQMTRAFYHGLSALEVGLLDDARQQFTRATELVPDEPAAWANLAISQLRQGEVEAAAPPMERALALAPDDSDMLLLAGRMETARGRLDEGIALLRQAAQLDPTGLRARVALAEELERAGGEAAEDEALRALDEVLARDPSNLSVIVDRARGAARRGDFIRLGDSLARLEQHRGSWPPVAIEQLENLQRASVSGNVIDSQRTSNMLRNVLARVPEFVESLTAVRTPTELVARPFDRFLVLAPPPATPSPADPSVRYQPEPLAAAAGAAPAAVALVPLGEAGTPAVFGADGSGLRRLDAAGPTVPFPGTPSSHGVLALDWNHDFLTDIALAGSGGLRLLIQGADGAFADATPREADGQVGACDCVAAWAADVEMDGDLDIVAGLRDGNPLVARNNGDGTWRTIAPFAGVPGARAFAWADLEGDADPDAIFLDASGSLHVFANRQAGTFTRLDVRASGIAAMTVADLDADGDFNIVTLGPAGEIRFWGPSRNVTQTPRVWNDLASWQGLTAQPASYRLMAADLDNNGGLDLVASGAAGTRVWLSDQTHRLQPLAAQPAGEVVATTDFNGDGRLDLVTPTSRLLGSGTAAYHWKSIRPRAQQNAGDQRINSFGLGGDIEVRSGLLVQKQVIAGSTVHVGLGASAGVDVVRVVWPNGVPQAEFGADVDDSVVAEQRLKGSCPWVFAWDGSRISFVTDFIWRSPLGLRINAQDTAGVVQTEDWVRVGGNQLVAKDGAYDVRITAELWETHFFDHVSLLAVDHPADTEVYVDERFFAPAPPTLAVHALSGITSVARARDESGRDVTDLVARRDGRYLATFERGRYQGIAEEHFVEFELDQAAWSTGAPTLVAHGWIYPTDSSINVAIGQGSEVRPSGLSLEAQGSDGGWIVVQPDVGFPAGKNKTILLDLGRAKGARRLRLRTNLEIYWDWLAVGTPAAAAPKTTRLAASVADLQYRGFSATTSPRGQAPETPDYARVETRSQRWRDLEGYHTRFGDVRELLSTVDDRYVIMNAGDEMRLLFPEQPAPPAGWRRDFVLVGDGWEKDGDYNTAFSQTVLPLPSHDRPAYGAGVTSLELEDDPVYQRHRADWERYHTRYVTPRAFVRGLRR